MTIKSDPVIQSIDFDAMPVLDAALGLSPGCPVSCVCSTCAKRRSPPPDCECRNGTCGLASTEIVVECEEHIDVRRNKAKKL